MYSSLIRPVLFLFDSEKVHNVTFLISRVLSKLRLNSILSIFFSKKDSRLKVSCFGFEFSNPVGLAAGFDKNCEALPLLSALGFAHVELGTVTAKPQVGNPMPRIFRYPKDSALINRMGFPSVGVDKFRRRLLSDKNRVGGTVVGVNIGKNKDVPIDDAAKDYLATFKRVEDLGDYFVLNVSSPNTPELRKLQEKDRLISLLNQIQEVNKKSKPILLKIAPDLDREQIDEIVECSKAASIDGLIACNTTSSRDRLSTVTKEAGGLSGKPVKSKSLDVVRYIKESLSFEKPVIAVGGISSAEDVIDYLVAGASMVQIYTGLIYEGPSLVKSICNDLLKELDRTSSLTLEEYVSKLR